MTGWIWEQFQAMHTEIKDHHLRQSQRKTNLSFPEKVKLWAKVKRIETEEQNDPYSARHIAIITVHVTGDVI